MAKAKELTESGLYFVQTPAGKELRPETDVYFRTPPRRHVGTPLKGADLPSQAEWLLHTVVRGAEQEWRVNDRLDLAVATGRTKR